MNTGMEETNNKAGIGEETDEITTGVREEQRRRTYIWYFLGILSFAVVLVFIVAIILIAFEKPVNNESSLRTLSMRLFGKDRQREATVNMEPRVIDGVMVKAGEENYFPLAVMIDNHGYARPPAGLSMANLVIEAEAEGSITRYLAVFADGADITEIGPVRSARPYYIDWAREFSALYTHVGGSPEALVKMNKDGVLHINEFYNQYSFWRGSNNPAPHNVYTSTEKLHEYIENKKIKEAVYFPWQYKDDAVFNSRGVTETINIPWPRPSYEVSWKYDRNNNNYIRFLDGEIHKDQNGDVITAKNILIEKANTKVIDDQLRVSIETIGEGNAFVCLDGACFEARWKKPSATARTRFYIEDNEVKLNRGTTWIEVVRPEWAISY